MVAINYALKLCSWFACNKRDTTDEFTGCMLPAVLLAHGKQRWPSKRSYAHMYGHAATCQHRVEWTLQSMHRRARKQAMYSPPPHHLCRSVCGCLWQLRHLQGDVQRQGRRGSQGAGGAQMRRQQLHGPRQLQAHTRQHALTGSPMEASIPDSTPLVCSCSLQPGLVHECHGRQGHMNRHTMPETVLQALLAFMHPGLLEKHA